MTRSTRLGVHIPVCARTRSPVGASETVTASHRMHGQPQDRGPPVPARPARRSPTSHGEHLRCMVELVAISVAANCPSVSRSRRGERRSHGSSGRLPPLSGDLGKDPCPPNETAAPPTTRGVGCGAERFRVPGMHDEEECGVRRPKAPQLSARCASPQVLRNSIDVRGPRLPREVLIDHQGMAAVVGLVNLDRVDVFGRVWGSPRDSLQWLLGGV